MDRFQLIIKNIYGGESVVKNFSSKEDASLYKKMNPLYNKSSKYKIVKLKGKF